MNMGAAVEAVEAVEAVAPVRPLTGAQYGGSLLSRPERRKYVELSDLFRHFRKQHPICF